MYQVILIQHRNQKLIDDDIINTLMITIVNV
jgi:hypothetical protein